MTSDIFQRNDGVCFFLAAGNSDGDFQMLEWTTADKGPRLGMIIHHTDAERESHIGKLDKALDAAKGKGWIVTDMKADWRCIYPPEK